VCFGEAKESNQTLLERLQLIKKMTNLSADINQISALPKEDETLMRYPCIYCLTDLKENFKVIDCNLSFVTKVMIPKGKMLNGDLL
jgi:hypothetical protein